MDIKIADSGKGSIKADADSLQHITCINSLKVNTSQPVSLPALTRVNAGVSIGFPTPSFSAPSLSTVNGGLSIGASTLTTLGLSSLSNVEGGLVISGTLLSTLGGVGCATITGGLEIAGNMNLPQADALARAACMNVVSGGVSVHDNKP